MSSIFSPFHVRIDPWQVDYGAETPLEPLDETPDESVSMDVDIAPDEWRPIVPRPGPAPARISFVDGIRRLETRLLVRRNGRLLHGCFGSFAVGSVQVISGRATFGESRLGRLAILGCNQKLSAQIQIRARLHYDPHTTAGEELQDPPRALQNAMRETERHMARSLAEHSDALVVCDGPLSFETGGPGEAVGYIKRITRFYLPSAFLPLLASLPPGARTPLFGITAKGNGFARFAWFMRLGPVAAGDSEMHGLVRLEVSRNVGIDRARALADLTARLLPSFAPPRGRDPRAPQNLFPIGALEQRLRRALGDQALLRRWIQTFVAKEATHA